MREEFQEMKKDWLARLRSEGMPQKMHSMVVSLNQGILHLDLAITNATHRFSKATTE
jgi:hypothetical protein